MKLDTVPKKALAALLALAIIWYAAGWLVYFMLKMTVANG